MKEILLDNMDVPSIEIHCNFYLQWRINSYWHWAWRRRYTECTFDPDTRGSSSSRRSQICRAHALIPFACSSEPRKEAGNEGRKEGKEGASRLVVKRPSVAVAAAAAAIKDIKTILMNESGRPACAASLAEN